MIYHSQNDNIERLNFSWWSYTQYRPEDFTEQAKKYENVYKTPFLLYGSPELCKWEQREGDTIKIKDYRPSKFGLWTLIPGGRTPIEGAWTLLDMPKASQRPSTTTLTAQKRTWQYFHRLNIALLTWIHLELPLPSLFGHWYPLGHGKHDPAAPKE